MKRIISCLLICMLVLGSVNMAYADAYWPSDLGIEAEGGILIDADTGAVLYGQNIHIPYYPASITKILTALIIIENCSMDDVITFSHNAVYNVESGSSSAGYDEGDTLTVKDALYAMLLKSANEVANALAEHCAGSIEAFADMMNEKAAALGCTESHFSNPSGLNDENHYTTAYDYSLIAKAAYANETFVAIDSTTYYQLPPSKKNPEGQTVYCGHKMLKKNNSLYYDGIIGGKTGYTTIAGNTLVTCAQREGLKLITVILNGHKTHYTDTKALLDFGFANFEHLPIEDYIGEYTKPQELLSYGKYNDSEASAAYVDTSGYITLPMSADTSLVTTSISYELTGIRPQNAIAKISAIYDEREVGYTFLCIDEERLTSENTKANENTSEVTEEAVTTNQESKKDVAIKLSLPVILAAILVAILAAIYIFLTYQKRKEEKELMLFKERRRKRRIELGLPGIDENGDISADSAASVGSYTGRMGRRKRSFKDKIFRK